jgi:hypothetical protein
MAVPVIGLLSSAILLREPLAPLVVTGLILVLIGVAAGRAARAPGDTAQ